MGSSKRKSISTELSPSTSCDSSLSWHPSLTESRLVIHYLLLIDVTRCTGNWDYSCLQQQCIAMNNLLCILNNIL